jgi:Concanavalin A-like lectin/glucanases superfamily
MAEMSSERELLRMFDALFEGRIAPEDERRLAERLRDDPAACLQYVRYADIHATLTDTRRFGEVASRSGAPIEHDDGDTRRPAGSEVGPKHESTALLKQIIATSVGALSHSSADDDVVAQLGDFRKVERRGGLRSYVVGLSLVLAGVLIGGVTMWRVAAEHFNQGPIVVANAAPGGDVVAGSYVATLVNVTNCRWDQARSTANLALGSSVRSGESLHLLEGAAEINLKLKKGGMAGLQLEGPLAMSLNSEGMPNLLYGHLTGSFTCDFDKFSLDTPLGRVGVSGDASIGVIAAANKVELHVFTGSASLELWAIGVGGAAKQMTAAAGSSLSARVEADGSISVEHGKAKETGFLTPAALAASQLHISDEYVAAIRAAKPVGYWRFEGDVDGMMRNEMSDRLQCHLVGDAVRWHPGHDGSSVEFGASAGPGYLISDDTFATQSGNYSVELWAKPTYFHHATLFTLLQWDAPQSPVGTHRMALEVCGPVSWFTSPYRTTDPYPGRIRFVHECRTGFDKDCYSPKPYSVRQWQHLVAVKATSEMRLYLNGKLVDSKPASGALPAGVRVLMGQLLPVGRRSSEEEVTPRLFSGELDEVALYDRELTDSEITQHFDLVHSKPEIKGEKSSGGT